MLHLPDWSRIDLPGYERHIRDMFNVGSACTCRSLRDDECIGLLTLVSARPNAFGDERHRARGIIPRPGAHRDREHAAVQ